MKASVSFNLPPARAIEFFRAKGLSPSFAWQDMLHAEHDAAFTVAKMLDVDLLRDVRDAVDAALSSGQTFADFRRGIEPLLMERGWWGKADMLDPLTGEVKPVQLGSVRRLETIFRTNLRTAYAAGHWSSIVEHADEAPYLLYDAILDGRTRPAHRAWDGKVLRVDDPWLKTHTPPNGWNCRCSLIQLDRKQLERLGKQGPDAAPSDGTYEWINPRTGEVLRVPNGIDPGWAYNPGASRAKALGEQLAERARAWPELGAPAVAAAERATRPDLGEMLNIGKTLLGALAAGDAPGTLSALNLRRALRESPDIERGRAAKVQGRASSAGAVLVREASSRYPASWVQAADEFGPLYVRKSAKRGWQYSALSATKRLQLPGFGVVDAPAGAGFIVARNVDVAVHEFAHRLQHAIPELDDYFQQLHVRRTEGDALRKLKIYDERYGAHEVAQEDGYVNPYTGRVYAGEEVEYAGRAGALEVMTMAYQYLFGESVEALQKALDGDAELIALAVALLHKFTP